MIEWLKQNYQWLFSGVGVTIIIFVLSKVFGKSKNTKPELINNAQTTTVNITNNLNGNSNNQEQKSTSSTDDTPKSLTRILFIDDNHTEYKMVSILKKSGWPNTKSVKDITGLDDIKVLEADVIFVDINGVGTNLFQDQGLGLASALKKKFPNKKIVLYSSESKGDRFHKALREVDGCLYKDAEPYQFINLIETFSNKSS